MLQGACRIRVLPCLLCAVGATAVCRDKSCGLPEDFSSLLQHSAQMSYGRIFDGDGDLEPEEQWMPDAMPPVAQPAISVIPNVPLQTQMDYGSPAQASFASQGQTMSAGYPQVALGTAEYDEEWSDLPTIQASPNDFPAIEASMTQQALPQPERTSSQHSHGVGSFTSLADTGEVQTGGMAKLSKAIADKEGGNTVLDASIKNKRVNKVSEKQYEAVTESEAKTADKINDAVEKVSGSTSESTQTGDKDTTKELAQNEDSVKAPAAGATDKALDRLDKILRGAAAEHGGRSLDTILASLAGVPKKKTKTEETNSEEVAHKQSSPQIADAASDGLAALYDTLSKAVAEKDALDEIMQSPAVKKKEHATVSDGAKAKDVEGFEELMRILGSSKADDPKSTSEKVRQTLGKDQDASLESASSAPAADTSQQDSSGFEELLRTLAAGMQVKPDSSKKTAPTSSSDNDSDDVANIVSSVTGSLGSADKKKEGAPMILTESMRSQLSQLLSQSTIKNSVAVAKPTPTADSEKEHFEKQQSEKVNKLLGALDQFLRSNGIGHIALS